MSSAVMGKVGDVVVSVGLIAVGAVDEPAHAANTTAKTKKERFMRKERWEASDRSAG